MPASQISWRKKDRNSRLSSFSPEIELLLLLLCGSWWSCLMATWENVRWSNKQYQTTWKPSIIKNKRALKKKRPYIEPCGTPLEFSRINGSPLSLEQYFLCSQADCIKCLFHVCKHNSYNPSFTTTDFLFGSFKNWPEAEEELDFWTRSSCKLTNCKEAWSLFPSLNADINYEVAGWNVRFSDQYEERRNRFNLPINTV